MHNMKASKGGKPTEGNPSHYKEMPCPTPKKGGKK